MTFISKPIEVVEDSSPRRPRSFVWDGTEYVVEKIIAQWQDWNFSAGAKKRDWRSRRHRNYYHVRATDGSEFELYLDRGASLLGASWYLNLKLK